MLKRAYNSSKNDFLGRCSTKGKDLLTKSSASLYNYVQIPDTSDTDPNNITFPYLRPANNHELLPNYTAVLNRSLDNGIGMNDVKQLDQLQQELEKLLSASAVRNRLLHSEFELIDRVEERHDKKGKYFDKPPSPKHRRLNDKKHAKDNKPPYKLLKNCYDDIPKPEIPKIILPKNDTKSKFWLSVDPFCAPVSRDDIAFLEDLIQECSKELDVKIPEVGQHYSEKWNAESQEPDSCVGTHAGKSKGNMINSKHFNHRKNGFFLLTSTFLEENCNKMAVMPEIGLKPIHNSNLCLDKRLRNELVELEILDPIEDVKPVTEDDELLQEIKLSQAKLCTLNEHNKKELSRLRNMVTRDMIRQEIGRKLDEVDNKIADMYKNLLTNSEENDVTKWEAIRIIELQKELSKEFMEMTEYCLE